MTISSEQINNLLAYARERHGAPCRVELSPGYKGHIACDVYLRDLPPIVEPADQILRTLMTTVPVNHFLI